METAAEKLGGDFYLIPSSTHEVLLVRDDGEARAAELDSMVREVNASVVDPSEQLVDHAFHYDSKNKLFERASVYEERVNADREITVLSIRPNKHPEMVTVQNDYKDLRLAVCGDIEVVHPFGDGVALIVNETGKLDGLESNRALRDENGEVYDIIAGNFLVVGDTEDGFRSLTPDEAAKYGEMFRDPEAFFKVGKSIKAVPIPDDVLGAMDKEKQPKAKNKNKDER
ncbi:MAG: DUF5688 family protein [Eubacteriales bacterium]|nr:DUF5688 family protein [Eubacteriales bacterium]